MRNICERCKKTVKYPIKQPSMGSYHNICWIEEKIDLIEDHIRAEVFDKADADFISHEE